MFWQILVGVICWVVGVFGFSQIVGVIKYHSMFTAGKSLATILVWLIILGIVAGVPILINSKLWIGVCIGYGISFLSSLRVTPD